MLSTCCSLVHHASFAVLVELVTSCWLGLRAASLVPACRIFAIVLCIPAVPGARQALHLYCSIAGPEGSCTQGFHVMPWVVVLALSASLLAPQQRVITLYALLALHVT